MDESSISDEAFKVVNVLQSIMLRVSFETLVECLQVCKKWRTAILDEGFKQNFLRQSKARRRVLFQYNSQPPERLFQSVSQEKPPLLHSKRQLRINSDEDLEMVSEPQQGVVCFSRENQFILCNLGTKKSKILPKPEGQRGFSFFGYDDAGGVFKLLTVPYVNVARGRGRTPIPPPLPLLLTVKLTEEEESWRSVDALSYTPLTPSVCINGVLHFGARSFVDPNKYKVVTFNLGSERFGLIDLPDELQINPVVDRLVKYRGTACLVKYDNCFDLPDGKRVYRLFVKEENEEKLSPILVQIPGWRNVAGNLAFDFTGTTEEDEELVFAASSVGIDGYHYVIYFNSETELLTKIKIDGGSSGDDVVTEIDHFDSLLLT
ncbi:hypothetical protein BRARA_E03482 [Brassica rapa]|uniref:F-box domain-containing protein n=1 Tax=Brassica campestris TaxID=3711 RepID=A0A397ZPP5_BRACM|nr:hypothetical protein BRARA_E03482 [Brassica rapa]